MELNQQLDGVTVHNQALGEEQKFVLTILDE